MNTIDRARVNTRGVFHPDARLGNDVGHWSSLPEFQLMQQQNREQ
jgi:hypothetical protein